MNILFLAAERAPFVKVGGLGDVVGALPQVLARLGHDVRVCIPHYGAIDDGRYDVHRLTSFPMQWQGATVTVEVSTVDAPGHTYFLRGLPYFQPHEHFIYSEDGGIDIGRFLFFCVASMTFAQSLSETEGWQPELVHAHDWHTALTPYLLRSASPLMRDLPSVLTIHNMQYQGWGIGWHLAQAGLPPVDHSLLMAQELTDNALAVGLAYSTLLNTVSPTYAEEILESENAHGLDGLLTARRSRLEGILNGIDVAKWNPASSEAITQSFGLDTLDLRIANKRALQAEMGLPVKDNLPLLGAVTRLVEQKGPGLLVAALDQVLPHSDAQFVLLGSGALEFEYEFRGLAARYPDQVAIHIGFHEPLSERIYAGSDLFLMPSQFEPCGIGQMIALRYGSLPLVRSVGGLRDTVDPAVGFRFDDFSSTALAAKIRTALNMYANQPEEWRARQIRAMQQDVSWEASAARYLALYQRAVKLHEQYHISAQSS